MKVTKLNLPVMSSWLEDNQRRLDASPFLSGAFEARVILNRLKAKKEPLQDLTKDGMKGIFNGPRFARNYVNDPDYGLPLLSGADMLQAELNSVPFISKKQVVTMPYMVLEEGTTLISSYGTIGRTAYCRADMAGMVGSDNALKVIPDTSKILPGYLYAYLSSKFGVPLVISGLSGSIITFLDPKRVSDLPVPRLGEKIETEVHNLVEEASKLRTDANNKLNLAIQKLENNFNLPYLPKNFYQKDPDTSIASSNFLVSRLDGLFHSKYHKAALNPLLNLPESQRTTLEAITESIIEPTRFKRVAVDNPEYGIPFFGTSTLMCSEPKPNYYIPKKMSGIKQYLVDDKTLLVPRSGQLAGIIGHIVFPYGLILGGAVTEDAIRIKTISQILAGYLFIVLSSEYGRRQFKARAFGSSIPHLDVNMIGQVVIPKPNQKLLEEIGGMGYEVAKMRHEAIEKENLAVKLVEQTIEEGANG